MKLTKKDAWRNRKLGLAIFKKLLTKINQETYWQNHYFGIRDFTIEEIAGNMMKRRINVHVIMEYWYKCGQIFITIRRNGNFDSYMKVDQKVSYQYA
jgi:hypothetical protein